MIRISIYVLAVFLVSLSALAIYTSWQTQKITSLYPPAGIRINVGESVLHFTDQKPAGAPKATLVLIHGASGNEAEMRAALAAPLLARGYRVISIDRPGMGWSTGSANPAKNTLAGQAGTIRKAMNQHGIDKSIIVVHSLAGAIGLAMTLEHADFVQGLMMVSPVSHPWPGGIALHYTIAASQAGAVFNHALALPLGQMFLGPAVQSVFAPQKQPENYVTKTKLPLVLRPKTFAANARDVASLYQHVSAWSSRYKDIRMPVAILAGSADKIVITDIHSRSSFRQIPGATLRILPGVGHVPHWTHTNDVVGEIDALFMRTSNASRNTIDSSASNSRPGRNEKTGHLPVNP